MKLIVYRIPGEHKFEIDLNHYHRRIYFTSNYGQGWNLVNDELCFSALKFSYSNPEMLYLGNVPSCSNNYINALVFR